MQYTEYIGANSGLVEDELYDEEEEQHILEERGSCITFVASIENLSTDYSKEKDVLLLRPFCILSLDLYIYFPTCNALEMYRHQAGCI